MSDDDKPLDVQIGGDHYKSMAIQPMEYSMANKLDACQHTIIKYVTRFRDKGGVQDLEKAKHCIDLLIHFERQAATVKESLTVHPVHPATFDHIDPADVEISEQPAKCKGCFAGCRDCCPGLAKVADEKLARMRAASAERFVNECVGFLSEPASAIDDDSERMQAIGQNGNDGAVYVHYGMDGNHP